jgi:predicted phosphodiesterase
MRIIIFSDVHGNWHALQAVLADIERAGAYDHLLFGGDLVWGGGQPAECIRALQQRQIPGVYGNTDLFLWDMKPIPPDLPEEKRQQYEVFHATRDWLLEQISERELAYLKSLPFEMRFSPTRLPADDLLLVHANPKDISEPILPNLEMQKVQFDGLIQQPDEDVLPLLEGVTAHRIAFGHVHTPNVRQVGDYTLYNISSVSRPTDGDPRAKYAMLIFADGAWKIEYHYVEYDVAAAQQAILATEMPGREAAAQALLPQQ